VHRTLKKPSTIYLVRHAESDANADGNIIGGVDAKLTKLGEEQANALMIHLIRHPIPGSLMAFASDMPRAIMTAQAIANGLGIHPEQIIQDPRLREIARGDWDGLPRDVTYHAAVWDEMDALDMDHRAPNGESMSDVAARMRLWLFDLNRFIEQDDVTTFVAITHGMAIKSLLQRIFGLHPSYAWLVRIDNTSITKIRCSQHGWHLEYLNATPHLSGQSF
jgi:broad specificity phosphatase PhoE